MASGQLAPLAVDPRHSTAAGFSIGSQNSVGKTPQDEDHEDLDIPVDREL